MKFRTKLLVSFLFVSLVSNLVIFTILQTAYKRIVYKQIQSKVLSVAATVASLVDGDLHTDINSRSDEGSSSYLKLESFLRKARDANRRNDIHVSYLYTMNVSPERSDVVLFGVDAEESFENKSHVGDVYKGIVDSPLEITKNQVDEEFTKDQWGVWLSANAPIKDSQGNVVAALGADLRATDVIEDLDKVTTVAVAAFAGAVILSLIISFLLAGKISAPLTLLRSRLESIGRGELEGTGEFSGNDEFAEVGKTVDAMAEGLKEKRTLMHLLERYVSPQVAHNLLNTTESEATVGTRRKVTVLFSDIRGFTRLSERVAPEEVVGMLNEYLEKMVMVVNNNHGTAFKFIGDGMMSVFGALEDDPYQEEHAVITALEMLEELDQLSEKWRSEGRDQLSIGIGINSGNAVVGNVGSIDRMEYTVIGDTVNLASRIETATKGLSVDILISEYTYNAVRSCFETVNLGPISVKGRTDSVSVYAVKGVKRKKVING